MISRTVPHEKLILWRREFEEEIYRQDMQEDEHGDHYRFELDEDDTYHDKALQFMWLGYLMRCKAGPSLKIVK